MHSRHVFSLSAQLHLRVGRDELSLTKATDMAALIMCTAACLIWKRQGVAPWLRVLVDARTTPAEFSRLPLQSVDIENMKGGSLLP